MSITESLPPFLLNWEPLELDQLPLQVALLTMELAAVRQRLDALAPAGRPALPWLTKPPS